MCGVCASYLVSIHHEVVSGDERFEDHHPAGVGRALEQRVRQLGDVHIHLVGAVDEIWQWERGGGEKHESDGPLFAEPVSRGRPSLKLNLEETSRFQPKVNFLNWQPPKTSDKPMLVLMCNSSVSVT